MCDVTRVLASLRLMTDSTLPTRLGFAERDVAVEYLQIHHAEGRLTGAEFEARIERALQARTEADLQPLFGDLPASPTAPAAVRLLYPHGCLFRLPREPRYVRGLRIIGWASLPTAMIAMFVFGTFWLFLAALLVAPVTTALAEALWGRYKGQQRVLHERIQRKELW